MNASPVVDVQKILDAQPFSSFQARVVGLCILLQFFDGIDLQAIGYTGPGIREDLHLTIGQMGPIFSAGLFGMATGALCLGPVSDWLGRRAVMIASVFIFGSFTLAIAWAQSASDIMALRFLAGLGFGGALPNTLGMVAEYMPARTRYSLMGVSSIGFIGGGAVSGWIALALMPHYGWRSVFVFGGASALLVSLVLMAWLPESLRYLASKGERDGDARRVLRRIAPGLEMPEGARFVVPDADRGGAPVRHLFTEGRTIITLPFWFAAFFVLLDLYLLTNWIPILTKGLGLPTEQGVFIASLFQVGAGFAGVVAGLLLDRLNPFRVLGVFAGCGAIAVVLLGLVGPNPPLLMAMTFVAGFFIVGSQSCLNMSAATMYPTYARVTGTGWMLGIGRIGSIMGPLIGGYILTRDAPPGALFFFAALPMLCVLGAAVFLWIKARHLAPR